MMKVALRNAEYMATLPPYRFMPGDVIEVDDEWGTKMLQRGIAVKAKADAQTAMERRVAMRPPTPDDGGAAERAARRAALQAEIDAMDREVSPYAAAAATEGHYSDMVTREEPADDDEKPARGAKK